MTLDPNNSEVEADLAEALQTISRLQSELETLREESQMEGSPVTAQAEFGELIDTAPEMILVVSREGLIVHRNNKAEQLGEEAVFSACFQEPELVEGILEQGFVAVDQGHLCLTDGRLVLLSCSPIRFRGQDAHQYHLRDVTSSSLLSEELQLVHRMAAVGKLAGEVAHAINNPLSVVMGRVELLQALPPGQLTESGRHLEVMGDYVRRMAHIIKGLQIFARPGLGEIREIKVLDVLKTARKSCLERDESVRIVLDVEPEGLGVMADRVQLAQVFDGLMSSLAATSGRRSVIQVHAGKGGPGVIIGMGTDRGAVGAGAEGPKEWRSVESIPDRMGFGVSVGSAILREHGGGLSIGGSTVAERCYRIELPGWSDASERLPTGSLSNGQSILVVEDEQGVRELAVDMLLAAGYETSSVEDAEEGLARLAADAVDAILVDVNLPGMSGIAFRESVLSQWPEYQSRIILMTGLDIRAPTGVPMLRKPFSHASLLKAIGSVVGLAETVST
ncbi:MAG: response regulator [Myxococcota bacterium]|nr:response regulator [Myxococcota bacterium]